MLVLIDQIKERTGVPYRAICCAVRIAYPNWIRWRMRLKEQKPLVRQPGPPKLKPPDSCALKEDIAGLTHGNQRTEGAGALYSRYRSSFSRREIQQMIAMARRDQNSAHRQNLRRIRWNLPNVAWSMDPCEYRQSEHAGSKVYINQMQDLASRYKFIPMMGDLPCGEEISGYLADAFRRFGAPLFLKRDNGSNLNHCALNGLLADYFVLPLNSPVHYPPYNGAIEEAQNELKNGLATKLSCRPFCPCEHLEAYAAVVEHDLNHKPRPCLKGKNACQVYFSGRRTFTKWERRETYDWITNLQNDILRNGGVQPQTAWRVAVEAWLNMKGFITITSNGKVLPYFP
jgi:hypothetical protein